MTGLYISRIRPIRDSESSNPLSILRPHIRLKLKLLASSDLPLTSRRHQKIKIILEAIDYNLGEKNSMAMTLSFEEAHIAPY
jgi:hypothetical protein